MLLKFSCVKLKNPIDDLIDKDEQYKPIKDCSDYYITSKGRVFSTFTNKFMKLHIVNAGYYHVMIKDNNGKSINKYVHRLVADAFIDNPHNYNEVNHKDENKLNNNVDNLEWCSRVYNLTYKDGLSKRNSTKNNQVVCYDNNGFSIIFMSAVKAAKTLDICSQGIVEAIRYGRKYVGLNWRKANSEEIHWLHLQDWAAGCDFKTIGEKGNKQVILSQHII